MFRVREMSPSRKFDKVAHSKTFAARRQREIHEPYKISPGCGMARRRRDFEQPSFPIAWEPEKLYRCFGREAKIHD
jgi:hypothetical protein